MSRAIPKPSSWLLSMGPLSVVLSVLLLTIRQSPLYIDLSLAAIAGMAISSRFKWIGFLCASALLGSILCYQFFFEAEGIHWWELGLAATIEISFFIASLANLELLDRLKLFSQESINQSDRFESQLFDAKQGQLLLEKKLSEALEMVGSKTQAIDSFQQLLQVAKEEMMEQIAHREKVEKLFYDEKRENSFLEEKLSLLQEELQVIKITSQDEIQCLLKKQKSQSDKLTITTGQLQTLTDQLDKLTDRLRGLQSEKEELEKQLGEALQPSEIDASGSEKAPTSNLLRQSIGLYTQLRQQFEEKKHLLDRTRQELFLVNEELLLLQKRQKEEMEFDAFARLTKYTYQLRKANESILRLEKEVSQYEELITTLS